MAKAILTKYCVKADIPLKKPIVIAHISDLHERECDDILAMIPKLKPDIIVVTGDTFERYDNRPQYDFDHKPIKKAIVSVIHYVNSFLVRFLPDKRRSHKENSYRSLTFLSAIAPVYLSLGNHEQKLSLEDYSFLSEKGITLLDNSDIAVDINGCRILIGGMSTWDYEEWLQSFAKKKGFKLLLCHNPERFEEHIAATDIDLTLSGHTHGGQFAVGKKGRGFFVPGQGLFGKYAHGIFFCDRLIISSGCSNTAAFPRLFNPREAVAVTLKGTL